MLTCKSSAFYIVFVNTMSLYIVVINKVLNSPQQLVIQNARDKILGDRTLQEKLAENINKILAK